MQFPRYNPAIPNVFGVLPAAVHLGDFYSLDQIDGRVKNFFYLFSDNFTPIVSIQR